MTAIDITELRRLAMAAKGPLERYNRWAPDTSYTTANQIEMFFAACSPDVAIRLIDRVVSAEAERNEWARHYSATTEAAAVALASEVAAWQARAEAAEAEVLRLVDVIHTNSHIKTGDQP